MRVINMRPFFLDQATEVAYHWWTFNLPSELVSHLGASGSVGTKRLHVDSNGHDPIGSATVPAR